jgi:hypothetical protein
MVKSGQGFQIAADRQRVEFVSGNAAFVLPREIARAATRCIVLPILGKTDKGAADFLPSPTSSGGASGFRIGRSSKRETLALCENRVFLYFK